MRLVSVDAGRPVARIRVGRASNHQGQCPGKYTALRDAIFIKRTMFVHSDKIRTSSAVSDPELSGF
eukprot:scaffold1555_cov173-Amphora_coffeaeformis.AAC.15